MTGVCKLVLGLFIKQSGGMKSETQKILQEMLLDVVVACLDNSLSKKGDDVMHLLKLLSEVIRISRPGSSEEESFLTPGSAKVNSCINLLGKIITG